MNAVELLPAVRTIEKALQDLGETYTWRRSRSHSLGDLGMSNEPEPKIQAFSFSGREKPAPRGWIVDNHLWAGHETSWFGEGGVAKSLLALHLGLTVAAESRTSWMAFAVKTVPVLYLDFALDADEQVDFCHTHHLPLVACINAGRAWRRQGLEGAWASLEASAEDEREYRGEFSDQDLHSSDDQDVPA